MDTTSTGRRRNRSWPEALKREIVAASFAPGCSVSVVARHYDVNANQVFGWRKLYRDGVLAPADPTGSGTGPGDGHGGTGWLIASPAIACRGHDRDRCWPAGIVFASAAAFDGKALRRVLDVLERR